MHECSCICTYVAFYYHSILRIAYGSALPIFLLTASHPKRTCVFFYY